MEIIENRLEFGWHFDNHFVFTTRLQYTITALIKILHLSIANETHRGFFGEEIFSNRAVAEYQVAVYD